MISKVSSKALLILFGITGCADLPQLADLSCGNGVIDHEIGEQCDLFEDPAYAATRKVRCGDPSDTARGCRYVCSRIEVDFFQCPAGWGCGEDGVCHEASGSFEEMEDSPAEIDYAHDLNMADTNGDSRLDLIGFSDVAINISFGRRAGTFGSDFSIRAGGFARGVAIGDVDGDKDADILLPTTFGPAVLLGERDRTLAPVVFPQSTLVDSEGRPIPLLSLRTVPIRSVDCEPMVPEPDGGILVAAYFANQMLIQLPESPMAKAETLIVRPYETWDRAPGNVLVADLDNELDRGEPPDFVSLAEEVVFGLDQSGQLEIHEAHCRFNQNTAKNESVFRQRATIDLPGGWRVYSRYRYSVTDLIQKHPNTLLADLDGDGWRDLLISAVRPDDLGAPEEDGVFVAWRDPFGGFGPPQLDQRFRQFVAGSEQLTWPIVAENFDPVPGADFISGDGIFLARTAENGAPKLQQIYQPADGRWQAAVMVDLDSDGLRDVVALTDGIPSTLEVVFLRFTQTGTSGGQSSLLPESIPFPLSGTGSHLQVGDFDGDRYKDVAFIESAAQLGNTSISILYGGATPEVVSAGSPGYIHSITAFAIPEADAQVEPDFGPPIAARQLIAVTRQVNASMRNVWSIALLNGLGRTFVSPLLLSGPEPDEGDVPGQLVLGDFDPDNGTDIDLAAFGRKTVWVAEGTRDGRFDTEKITRFDINEDKFLPQCSVMATGNFDPRTPTEEIVGVLNVGCATANDPATSTVTNPGNRGPSETVLFVGGLDPAGQGGLSTLELEDLNIEQVNVLKVADLDLSGQPEVIFAFTEVKDPAEGIAGESGVAVYWNVQASLNGNLAYGEVTHLLADAGTNASAIAVLNADADLNPELLILVTDVFGDVRSRARARLIDFPSGGQSKELSSEAISGTLAGFAARRLLVADIDRDGIDDVVFADGKNVRLFRGLPSTGRTSE